MLKLLEKFEKAVMAEVSLFLSLENMDGSVLQDRVNRGRFESVIEQLSRPFGDRMAESIATVVVSLEFGEEKEYDFSTGELTAVSDATGAVLVVRLEQMDQDMG